GLAEPLALAVEAALDQLFAEGLQVLLHEREDGVNEADLLHAVAVDEVLVLVHDLDGIALAVDLAARVDQRAVVAPIGTAPGARHRQDGLGEVGEGQQAVAVDREEVPRGVREAVEVAVEGALAVGDDLAALVLPREAGHLAEVGVIAAGEGVDQLADGLFAV
ncbi:MAG: hypothetical protein ACK56I_07625, partial [bacterium]